jgi:hypothetical protein
MTMAAMKLSKHSLSEAVKESESVVAVHKKLIEAWSKNAETHFRDLQSTHGNTEKTYSSTTRGKV